MRKRVWEGEGMEEGRKNKYVSRMSRVEGAAWERMKMP